MTTLSPDQLAIATTSIHRRMREGSFVFQDIVAAANRSLGYVASDQQTPCYRLADRLMQKHRKAGDISFSRVGRQSVWSLTDKGKQALPIV